MFEDPTIEHLGPDWNGSRAKDIWRHRDLLYFLIWRDVKIRYKQSLFGVAWAILQPVTLMVVLTIFLSRVVTLEDPEIPYAIFALTGLVPWVLFSRGLVASSESLVRNVNLITKVYFPRPVLPLASVSSYLLDAAIAMVVLVVAASWAGLSVTYRALLMGPLAVAVAFVAFAFGCWLAAVNVRYRDVPHAVPFLMQVWLFATPVAYPVTSIPDSWRWVMHLNPVAPLVEGFRWALLGSEMEPSRVISSAALTFVVFVAGVVYFRRSEHAFADWI